MDRDGTVVEDTDFLTNLAALQILPGAAEAIRRFNQHHYKVILLTNQSGVARGFLSEARLREIHSELLGRLKREGATIDAVYYCPHHPSVGPVEYRKDCECRKPKPGMFLQAAKDWNVDLSQSFGIGDSLRDGEAALRAGAKPILVKTGPGSEEAQARGNFYYRIYPNLAEAAQGLLD